MAPVLTLTYLVLNSAIRHELHHDVHPGSSAKKILQRDTVRVPDVSTNGQLALNILVQFGLVPFALHRDDLDGVPLAVFAGLVHVALTTLVKLDEVLEATLHQDVHLAAGG